MDSTSKSHIKVTIVGGSIAGLTLANALSRQAVDFIVLESKQDIAPCVGAGICILPSGARILDQLGMFDEILLDGGPLSFQHIWRDDGRKLGTTESLKLMTVRQGYPAMFIERQRILQILFSRLPEKNRVLLKKKVTKIDSSATCAVVKCSDGSSYHSDIVVGADGVHSITRKEMWRHTEDDHSVDWKKLARDKQTLSARYSAIFGISAATAGMEIGHCNRTFSDGYSFFNAVGKEGRVFWFVFQDMKRSYTEKNMPRFDHKDVNKHVAPLLNKYVSAGVQFGDLFKNRIRCSYVPIQEGTFELWTWGRIVCIGDSIHKTTPNLGQGGNSAIESAASLSNYILELEHTNKHCKPSAIKVNAILRSWVSSRQPRANIICDSGNKFTKLEAFETLQHKILGLYLGKFKIDSLADILCDMTIGAEHLSYLPLPRRSLEVTMPYNRQRGIQATKSMWSKLLRMCLVLLATFLICAPTWGFLNGHIIKPSEVQGELGTDILSSYRQNMQKLVEISHIADLAVLQVIWRVESVRGGNSATLMSFSLLFSVLCYVSGGMHIVLPLYLASYTIQSPVSTLVIPDCRNTEQAYTKSLLPCLIIGYYAPGFWLACYDPYLHEGVLWKFLLLPVLFTVLHTKTASLLPQTVMRDRMYTPNADIQYLRILYCFCGLLSATASLSWRASEKIESFLCFLPLSWGNNPTSCHFSLTHGELTGFLCALVWLVFEVKDLKSENVPVWTWPCAILVAALSSVVFGPAATLIFGWWLREEALVKSAKGCGAR